MPFRQTKEEFAARLQRRPTIGPLTVALAAETGLRGIAVEAAATIVVDRDETVAAADRAGLFVFGIRRI